MAPRDTSPRASDNRRPYSDRRDHNQRDTRDTRPPRRDRSTSRDRGLPHSSRGGGGGRGGNNTNTNTNTHRTSERDTRPTRSRSPTRSSHNNNNSTRQRSPPRAPRGAAPPNTRQQRKPGNKVEEAPAAIDPDEDEETAMKRLMGFVGFKSTKNTKVPGNDKLYGVRKDKKTEYRQYMNRVGGFNRPLSPTRL
jgi:U4/U6.U5 tri-snRNP-associated protein 3